MAERPPDVTAKARQSLRGLSAQIADETPYIRARQALGAAAKPAADSPPIVPGAALTEAEEAEAEAAAQRARARAVLSDVADRMKRLEREEERHDDVDD